MKVGDRVRVLAGDKYTGPSSFFVGKVGTVTRVGQTSLLHPIRVHFDDGKEQFFRKDELEILSEEENKHAS